MGHMGYNLYGYYNLLPARELIWQKVEEEVHSWFQHVANRSILKSFHSSFRPPLPFCMLYVLLTATCNLSLRPLFTSGINWEPKTRSVSLNMAKPNAMATAQEDGGLIQITLLFISPLGHQPTALLLGQNFKGKTSYRFLCSRIWTLASLFFSSIVMQKSYTAIVFRGGIYFGLWTLTATTLKRRIASGHKNLIQFSSSSVEPIERDSKMLLVFLFSYRNSSATHEEQVSLYFWFWFHWSSDQWRRCRRPTISTTACPSYFNPTPHDTHWGQYSAVVFLFSLPLSHSVGRLLGLIRWTESTWEMQLLAGVKRDKEATAKGRKSAKEFMGRLTGIKILILWCDYIFS